MFIYRTDIIYITEFTSTLHNSISIILIIKIIFFFQSRGFQFKAGLSRNSIIVTKTLGNH